MDEQHYQKQGISENPVSEEQKLKDEFNAFLSETNSRIESKKTLRNQNLLCSRPPEEVFSKLDSSLKKNTAFVKKLKQFTASQLTILIKDMSCLNLTKYISEVSTAIVDAKLKMTDVPAAILLCSKLHQTYSEFSQHFFENWQKNLTIKSGEKIQNASKMRVDLRFYGELLSAGIFNMKIGLNLLGNVLMSLIAHDKDDHSNLSIILSFCRHCGEEYAGLMSKSMIRLSEQFQIEIPKSSFLTPEKQQNLKNLLRDYYQNLCKHLKSEHKELQSFERTNRKIMESKGELSNERKEKLELMQFNFEKLLSSAQVMSDLLNEILPDLPKDTEANQGGIIVDITDELIDFQLDPWGDDETKNFYVELPDLRLFLPNFAPKNISISSADVEMTEESLDLEIESLDVDEPITPIDVPSTGSPEPPLEEPITNHSSQPTKQYVENFLQNLCNCVNKELLDSAAIDFLLNLNTKNNRKKVTKALFGVQRTRLDLLPFYARFVATINLVSHDVAIDLCQLLKQDFKYHVKKKDQINIESKIKVVRFIGEMVKFGLYSKIEALFCLKILLLDYQHHHIEMSCAFLEVCGQYLYNSKESRLRTSVYLEQMMRLKTVTAMDSRHVAQIENCYYLVKPPEGMGIIKKIRPILHIYIRHLIFEELNKTNVDKIIKSMRRLNWDEKEVTVYVIKCLSKAYNVRYHLIRCLADLVSGLSSYQDKAMMKVIDAVFEDIRAGLEIHSPKLAQRRVAMAKYLGELYNYRLVESSNVLNTLYSIISLGVTMDHNIISEVDPPGSLFRLKLACILLDTCGQYFTSVMSRKRLDYYLIFFQQYYWFKKSDPIFIDESKDSKDLFPILMDHMYKDCFINVRPKLKLFKSFEQAKEAVEKLKIQFYPNLLATSQDGAGDTPNELTLESINEIESEMDDITEDNTSEAVGESDDEIRGMGDDDGVDDQNLITNIRMGSPSLITIDPLLVPKKHEPTQDDIEFDLAFEKMAMDSYQERIRETIKPSTKDIPVPIKITKSGKKTYEQLQGNDSPPIHDSVPFVLMLRGSKGGKQQFKSFSAPSDSHLAINLKLQEQKIKQENEKVKRLTLNITERIEEEDYQESLLQSQRSPLLNKYQKQNKTNKYKHQKGAPDADLIFG